MKLKFLQAAVAALTLSVCNLANAGLITFYDTVVSGQAHYDATVAASAVSSDNSYSLTTQAYGNNWGFSDFNISTASNKSWLDPLQSYGMTGAAINTTARTDTSDIINFTFSQEINAFGFELGDWGTCCYPSTVRASFDGGSWVDIGTMFQVSDNPNYDPLNAGHANSGGTNGKGIFIGLIDDTSLFNSVAIDFTTNGDILYAGGTIKYSSFEIGGAVEVESPTNVPEPSTLAVFALGIMGLATRRFKKQ